MDHSTYIRRTDSADTAVLMIHGIMGTPRHFDGLIPIIPAQWDIYNILLEGHGKSVSDFNKSSMEKWRRQVQMVLRSLSQCYAHLVVIAHSMGALLAMEAVHLYPDKVKKMILLAPALQVAVRPVMLRYSCREILGRIDPRDPRERAVSKGNSIKPDRRLWPYFGNVPRLLELLAFSRRCRRIPIRVPCLVFLSGKDELIPVSCGRYFQRVCLLPDSGHFYYPPKDHQRLLAGCKAFLKPL